MAAERRRVEGNLFAWLLCGVVKLLTGQSLAPEQLNPYRAERPESAELARIRAAAAQIAWKVMTGGNRAEEE